MVGGRGGGGLWVLYGEDGVSGGGEEGAEGCVFGENCGGGEEGSEA